MKYSQIVLQNKFLVLALSLTFACGENTETKTTYLKANGVGEYSVSTDTSSITTSETITTTDITATSETAITEENHVCYDTADFDLKTTLGNQIMINTKEDFKQLITGTPEYFTFVSEDTNSVKFQVTDKVATGISVTKSLRNTNSIQFMILDCGLIWYDIVEGVTTSCEQDQTTKVITFKLTFTESV